MAKEHTFTERKEGNAEDVVRELVLDPDMFDDVSGTIIAVQGSTVWSAHHLMIDR